MVLPQHSITITIVLLCDTLPCTTVVTQSSRSRWPTVHYPRGSCSTHRIDSPDPRNGSGTFFRPGPSPSSPYRRGAFCLWVVREESRENEKMESSDGKSSFSSSLDTGGCVVCEKCVRGTRVKCAGFGVGNIATCAIGGDCVIAVCVCGVVDGWLCA